MCTSKASFLLAGVFFAAAALPSFPVWARPRGPRAPSRLAPAAPPRLETRLDATGRNLSGELFYATCDYAQGCDTLEFASLDLATMAKTDLFDFPLGSYDDAFVADDTLIENEVTISLNWDSHPDWGYLAVFDLPTRKLVSGRNSSSCYALYQDPTRPSALLCLNLVAKAYCPPGTDTQCTLLKSIDRASGAETLIAAIQPGMAPFTVEALDLATGLLYACFAPVNGGADFVLVSIDVATGEVKHTAPFPYTRAFIELEYSQKTEKLYAVVEDSSSGKPLVYAGTVDPATATGTPLGPSSFFNASFPPATGGFYNRELGWWGEGRNSCPREKPLGLTPPHTHTHARAHVLQSSTPSLHSPTSLGCSSPPRSTTSTKAPRRAIPSSTLSPIRSPRASSFLMRWC